MKVNDKTIIIIVDCMRSSHDAIKRTATSRSRTVHLLSVFCKPTKANMIFKNIVQWYPRTRECL